MEQKHPIEETGRTVEEATERALTALGLERQDVQIEVLDEGSRGVLGIGAREARVRVSPRPSKVPAITTAATELLSRMGFAPAVSVAEGPESVRVAIEGENLGALIGKHGQTLAAVEAIVALIAGRRLGGPVRVEVDVMSYRERRRSTLEALARRTAERVTRSGREVALPPMEARDRRIVHVTLQDDPGVSTGSRGEGELRRVVVMPKSSASEPGSVEESGPNGRERRRIPQSGESASRARSGRAGASGRPERSRSANQGARRGSEARSPGHLQERVPNDNRGRGQIRRPAAASLRSGRPEGLPIDEELDAEIEAHLERLRKKAGDRTQPPADKSGTESGTGGSEPGV